MSGNKKKGLEGVSFATARRIFPGSVCTLVPALCAVAGAMLATLPSPARAAGAGYETPTRDVLVIEGVGSAGVMASREGGTPFVETSVIPTPEPPFFRNIAGTVRSDPMTLKFGAGLSASLYQWVQDALHPKTMLNRKNGYFAFVDAESKETGRLNFFDALISEITLPALDLANTRDAALLTVKLVPQATQLQMAPGATVQYGGSIAPKSGADWRTFGFAVAIEGGSGPQINPNAVVAMDAHTTTLQMSDPGKERVGTQVLPLPGPLVLMVREDSARQFLDWFNLLWSGPQTDPDAQQQYLRTVTVTYLKRDALTGAVVATYGTATFHQVGISRISPVPSQTTSAGQTGSALDRLRKVRVELYASALTLDIKGLAGN